MNVIFKYMDGSYAEEGIVQIWGQQAELKRRDSYAARGNFLVLSTVQTRKSLRNNELPVDDAV